MPDCTIRAMAASSTNLVHVPDASSLGDVRAFLEVADARRASATYCASISALRSALLQHQCDQNQTCSAMSAIR
jgi:hypothetical protein